MEFFMYAMTSTVSMQSKYQINYFLEQPVETMMAWRSHDPDNIAPELWDDTAKADSADELVGHLLPIAERYAEYYGITFEEVAFRVAGELLDWWPYGSQTNLRWTPSVLQGMGVGDVSLVIDHVQNDWGKCDGWIDSLKLIDEAAVGTDILLTGPSDPDHSDPLRDDSQVDSPTPRAGEDWETVFETDVAHFLGPMNRAGKLLEIANRYVNELGLSYEEASREVVQMYADSQNLTVAFYEAMNLRWDPASTPLDEWFETEWVDGIARAHGFTELLVSSSSGTSPRSPMRSNPI